MQNAPFICDYMSVWSADSIHFVPLERKHFPLIQAWFNQKHVQEYYSLRHWTLQDVEEKFAPYVQGDVSIQSFVILLEDNPIGMIQFYPVKEYPWPGQELQEDILSDAAGVDLFIGDPKFIGLGVGPLVVKFFLKRIVWKDYKYCIVDPDVKNLGSIRMFTKLGFTPKQTISTKDEMGKPVQLMLMILGQKA